MPGYFTYKNFIARSVGPDDLYGIMENYAPAQTVDRCPFLDRLSDDVHWVVYDYTEDPQTKEGEGMAIIAYKNNTFFVANLAYDPFYGLDENPGTEDHPVRLYRHEMEDLHENFCLGNPALPRGKKFRISERLWDGVVTSGLFAPTRTGLKNLLASNNKQVREYAVVNILPLIQPEVKKPTGNISRKP